MSHKKESHAFFYIAGGFLNYSTFQVETSALSQRVSMSHVLPTTPPEIFRKKKKRCYSKIAKLQINAFYLFFFSFTRSTIRDSS